MPSSRRYNDQEIGALIQRATELYEASGRHEENLSLDEVEQIAQDLGVPVEYVRAAAVEMAGGDSQLSSKNVLGFPFVERITDLYDAEISDEQWEDLIMEMRRLEGSGTITVEGSIREWKKVIQDMNTTLAGTRLTARTKNGQTIIELQKFSNGAASVSYILALILGFVAAGSMMDGSGLATPIIFSVAASGGLGALGLTRLVLGAWSRRQRSRLEWVAHQVRSVLGPVSKTADEGTSSPEGLSTESSADSAVSTIELPDEEEASLDQNAATSQRERYS